MWLAKAGNHPLTTTLDPASTMETTTIEKFRPVFTAPTFCNFRFLIVAWLKCGQAKISWILFMGWPANVQRGIGETKN